MPYPLVLSPGQKSTFDKIVSDLKYALKDLTSEELFAIFKDASVHSFKTTLQTKKKALINTASFLDKTITRYQGNGFLNSAKADAKKAGDFLLSLPDKAQNVYANFLKLKREEQIEVVVVTIMTVAIFFATSGGTDLEGGLPDTDIAITGIGHHRNFISHSILIGLGVEFTGRFSISTLNHVRNRMPFDKHPLWDTVYNYIDKHKEKAVAAMWLGIGAHLIKDSGIFGGGVTPYKDLPFSMPVEAHQSLFAANGVVSGMYGVQT